MTTSTQTRHRSHERTGIPTHDDLFHDLFRAIPEPQVATAPARAEIRRPGADPQPAPARFQHPAKVDNTEPAQPTIEYDEDAMRRIRTPFSPIG